MRKLFKPKAAKPPIEDLPLPSLFNHQRFVTPPPPTDQDRWEVVPSTDYIVEPSHNSSYASLPPGASPPTPVPNGARSPSPFSIVSNKDRDQQQQQVKRRGPLSAPVALKILGALDPTLSPPKPGPDDWPTDGALRDREKDPPEKKDRRLFWSRSDKDKDKDKDQQKDRGRIQDVRHHGRDRGRDGEAAELTRMIGFLAATAHQDPNLVKGIVDRINANDSNAKEAARALRREFKYAETAAQLAAIELWGRLIHRVKNESFFHQLTARKFVDTLEDILSPSSRASPVVRERLLEVIGAAAWDKITGFRDLWKRVKPHDKPEEGMPMQNDDVMFYPGRPQYDNIPQVVYQDQPTFPADLPTIPNLKSNPSRKYKTPESRNRIIPPDEDIRRLFQECKIGQGNASLLSQALALSRPEDLKKKDIIKEFYYKCRSSQELIFAQISWATAQAEKSRATKDQEALVNGQPEEQRLEETVQEKLLGSLLYANGELMDALQQYDDLERVAIERLAEEVSRRDTKMDPRQIQQLQQDGDHLSDTSHVLGRTRSEVLSTSRSRSPSPMPAAQATYHHQFAQSHSHLELGGTGGLAPPRPAPQGPRLPAQLSAHTPTYSRTPSPPTPVHDGYEMLHNGMAGMRLRKESVLSVAAPAVPELVPDEAPAKPSEKALGKQRVVEDDPPDHYREEDYFDGRDETYSVDSRVDSDDDRSTHEGWPYHRPQQQFVYDAVAERTKQRIREGQSMFVNGVY